MIKIKAMRLVWILLPLLLATNTTSAGLGVTGAIFEATVAPGEHISHKMIVNTEASDQPMDFVAEVVGFGRSLDGTTVEIDPELDTSLYTARPFLNVTPARFHLEPAGSREVILEGDVPTDVGEGGIYALVNIRSLPVGESNVGVVVAVDVPVRLTIANTKVLKTGEITSLSIDKPISAKEQNVALIFNNTGNYHYDALAEAVLRDAKGNVLANASTPLTFASIIPTTSRLFEIKLTPGNELLPGGYNIISTVRLEDGTVLATKGIDFKI